MSTKRVNTFLQLQELDYAHYYSCAGGVAGPGQRVESQSTGGVGGLESQYSGGVADPEKGAESESCEGTAVLQEICMCG